MTTIEKMLVQLSDEKYRIFSSSLLPGVDHILGVRLPILRKLSRTLTLEELSDDTFEEIMLQGMVIAREKDFTLWKEKCFTFLPKINNWSVCDSFVSSLSSLVKRYPNEMFSFLKELSTSEDEYTRRFVLVMFLKYYIKPSYIEEVVTILHNIKKTEYYVQMASAWLIAEIYYYQEDLGKDLIARKKDAFIQKKALQKVRESLKIPNNGKIEKRKKEEK